MNTRLYDSLYTLYLKLDEKIADYKDSLMKIPYERIKAHQLSYDHGYTMFEYDWENIEYYDVYEWPAVAFNQFMQKELDVLSEYQDAANQICEEFNIPEKQRESAKRAGLWAFIGPLMKQIPNNRINKKNVNEYINVFISYYRNKVEGGETKWQIQTWICNIDFEGDEIALDGFVLRRPQPEELMLEQKQTRYLDNKDRFNQLASRSIHSNVILEFSIDLKESDFNKIHDIIQQKMEMCLDILRLFKVGNIYAIHQTINPDSIFENSFDNVPESPFDKSWKNKIGHEHSSNYSFKIEKVEFENFISFFNRMKPILENVSQKNYFNGDYLDLSIHRYKDALLRSEVNVNRVVSSISCLEALLSNSHTEITYKISIHVSGLLKHLGFDSKKVFDKMKDAYSIRSAVLHGSKLKDKPMEFSKNHTHEIVNYARLCLLIILQLKGNFKKDELIDKIDYSLLDEKSYSGLEEIIKNNVVLPVIYPFSNITGGDEIKAL